MENDDILSASFVPTPEVIVNRLGNDTVALNLANGTYYGFDLVGTRIWDRLTSGEELRSICSQVALEFDVPTDQVEADARVYLSELLKNKLISRK